MSVNLAYVIINIFNIFYFPSPSTSLVLLRITSNRQDTIHKYYTTHLKNAMLIVASSENRAIEERVKKKTIK